MVGIEATADDKSGEGVTGRTPVVVGLLFNTSREKKLSRVAATRPTTTIAARAAARNHYQYFVVIVGIVAIYLLLAPLPTPNAFSICK